MKRSHSYETRPNRRNHSRVRLNRLTLWRQVSDEPRSQESSTPAVGTREWWIDR